MPAQRHSRGSKSPRSRSTTAAPPQQQRPGSSNSTNSGHSFTQDAGAPYPRIQARPPPAQQQQQQHMPAEIDSETLASLLQHDAAASQTGSHSPIEGPFASSSQPQMPMQHHHQLPPQVQHMGPQQMQPQQFYHVNAPQQTFQTPAGYDYQYSQQQQQQQQHMHHMQPMQVMEQEVRRPRVSTGQTNERELKEMLDKNTQRSLEEVAEEVIATERTSSSEKSKQLFAMLWLSRNLVKSKASVPRTRVHTQYAGRCARHHLQPLNPASFGKLVRVLFPDIGTRRLGIRGESKYHYVDLSLADDLAEASAAGQHHPRHRPSLSIAGSDVARASLPFDVGRLGQGPDSALMHTTDVSMAAGSPAPRAAPTHRAEAQARAFPDPYKPMLHPPRPTAVASYSHQIRFASHSILHGSSIEDMQLPNIWDYCSEKTDRDAVDALATLYLAHVTSLVDCIRYCREKGFFKLYTSFQGTLTVPVQKLYVHEDLAPWVKECDYLMYQTMVRVLGPLTLQVIPAKVMKFLNSVSQVLDAHLTKTLEQAPQHLVDAKLEPANIFMGLLNRMLRANQAAHAAGSVLIADDNRNRMWTEYVRFSNPKQTMTAVVPDCGYDKEVYEMLTYDIRHLLLPLSTPMELEYATHFHVAALAQSASPQPESFELDKMGLFFESLKSRLPSVPSRELTLLVQAVSSRILRDVVMEHGESYNCWLIAMTFVDELILWLSHAGGFLEREPVPSPRLVRAMQQQMLSQHAHVNGTASDAARHGIGSAAGSSRYSSSAPDGSSNVSMANATFGGHESAAAFGGMNVSQHQQARTSLDTASMAMYTEDNRMVTDSPAMAGTPLQGPSAGMSPEKDLSMDDSGIGLSLQFEVSDVAKSLGSSINSQGQMPSSHHPLGIEGVGISQQSSSVA